MNSKQIAEGDRKVNSVLDAIRSLVESLDMPHFPHDIETLLDVHVVCGDVLQDNMRLKSLVYELADSDRCAYDRAGNCMTHSHYGEDGLCPHDIARKILPNAFGDTPTCDFAGWLRDVKTTKDAAIAKAEPRDTRREPMSSDKQYDNPVSAAIAEASPDAENELYEHFGECRTFGDLFDLAMAAMHVCGRGHPIDHRRLLSALMDNRCQDAMARSGAKKVAAKAEPQLPEEP